MITAGLQSLATPSKYGGGPLDIFQGVLAGQGAIDARNDRATAQRRKQMEDDINAAKAAAEIEMHKASARHSDASAVLRIAYRKIRVESPEPIDASVMATSGAPSKT